MDIIPAKVESPVRDTSIFGGSSLCLLSAKNITLKRLSHGCSHTLLGGMKEDMVGSGLLSTVKTISYSFQYMAIETTKQFITILPFQVPIPPHFISTLQTID